MNNFSLYKGGKALYCLIFMAVFLASSSLQASVDKRNRSSSIQQDQIQGTVTDGTAPLPGVTIAIKNKLNSSTISDYSGQYTISASPNDTLIVSFIGFKTAFVPVKARTKVDVQLLFDTTTLQEVRVNAGYYTVKEKERTGSIVKVKATDFEKQPVNNPLAAMQGRMSGVNIAQKTGVAGGGFTIQIRGLNSIRGDGNEPLYVIDGVPYSPQSLGNSDLSSGSVPDIVSPLNSINPSDIENIEVLKDADATAIYGSRGANGVVLISTKKGKSGKTRFNIRTFTTVGKITRKLDLMNTEQYISMREEAFANDGFTVLPQNAYDVNGTWNRNKYTDWQKELLGGTAYINNAQASISGGNTSTQFLLSGTYRKETSVFTGDSHYGKGVVNANITHKSADENFNLTFSANYSGDKNTLPGADLTHDAYTLAPNAPSLYDAQGNLNWENGTFNNPLAYLNGTYQTNTNNLISNVILSYKFLSGFEVKTSLGYNDYRLAETRTSPSTIYNPSYGLGPEASTLFLNNAKRSSWIIEPQLTWQKTWHDFQISTLIGTTFQEQRRQSFTQAGSGFPSNALINNMQSASYIEVLDHSLSEYKYNAIFGRVNLKWKEKYIFNLTGRRDGSSRFGPGNRFANFGAIGGAWIFSNETLIKNNLSFLSFGKLRGSFGIAGNDQIGDYQFLDTYQVSGNNYNGVTGIKPTRLYNPEFGWENNKKLEGAIELGFFQDKLFLTTAYFRNRSSNQLVGVPLPGLTGFPTLQSNLDATVQNTGVEIDIRNVNFRKKDFNWTTSLNLTIPKNKLISFPNLDRSTYSNSLVIGESLSIQKLYEYTGINPQTGAYQFRDFNGDGLITATKDRQHIADTSPEYYGGLNNILTYKNWELDFLFQFVKQKAYNYLFTAAMPGTMVNQTVDVLNHFPQNGSESKIQQYSTGQNATIFDAYSKYSRSDAAISDASFIRLKNISLSYTLPSTFSKSVNAKVYFQSQNLLTLTHYMGADPETHSAFFLPPLRQFTLGIQLNF